MTLLTTKNKKSTAAVLITGIYLLALAIAFIIMLITAKGTAMSGIFLIMVTAPWSLLLIWLLNLIQVSPAPLISGLFLLIGGAANGYILYKLISMAAHRFNK